MKSSPFESSLDPVRHIWKPLKVGQVFEYSSGPTWRGWSEYSVMDSACGILGVGVSRRWVWVAERVEGPVGNVCFDSVPF